MTNWGMDGTLGLTRTADLAPAMAELGPAGQRVASLFELYREPLYRYVLQLTWSPGDSEELVQEIFLKLHRELTAGREIGHVRAWLFRVGHNLAMDHARAAVPAQSLSEEHVVRGVEDRLAAATPDPERLLLEGERQRRLAAAMDGLPALQRHCLLLRGEGLRYREIAGILAVGETTVIDNLRRAVERLNRELHAQPAN